MLLLVFIIPLCYSKTFSNNNNTQDSSILNQIRFAAIDEFSFGMNSSYDSWRIPNTLSYPSQCKPHYHAVKIYISYVVIKNEEKIVACSKNAPIPSTFTTRFIEGRFPSSLIVNRKCKKGYRPLEAQIDVIYKKENMLTSTRENIVYGCDGIL